MRPHQVVSNRKTLTAVKSRNRSDRICWLFGWLLLASAMAIAVPRVQAAEIPQRLIDNHRATMGCWLADIDNDELSDKAIVITLGVQTLYGFICSSSLSGDSYRIYQVEDERDEWANLLSFSAAGYQAWLVCHLFAAKTDLG